MFLLSFIKILEEGSPHQQRCVLYVMYFICRYVQSMCIHADGIASWHGKLSWWKVKEVADIGVTQICFIMSMCHMFFVLCTWYTLYFCLLHTRLPTSPCYTKMLPLAPCFLGLTFCVLFLFCCLFFVLQLLLVHWTSTTGEFFADANRIFLLLIWLCCVFVQPFGKAQSFWLNVCFLDLPCQLHSWGALEVWQE